MVLSKAEAEVQSSRLPLPAEAQANQNAHDHRHAKAGKRILRREVAPRAGNLQQLGRGAIQVTAPLVLKMVGEVAQLTSDFVRVVYRAAAEVVDGIGGGLPQA
jgi:hypothetical protein